MASRKRRGPEDYGMRLARQIARATPAGRRMRADEKLEWRRQILADTLRREGIAYREAFDRVLLDARLRESQRATHESYVRAYGREGRQPSSGSRRKAPPLPESARYPIVVIYSDGTRSRHSEARIAYDYAEPRIKFMGPGAWAEIYREDTGSYHPETGSPFAALEVNEYGHVLHGGIKRRTRTAGDRRRSVPPKYGNKRDYPKIDIFVDGDYRATTTWARTLDEARRKFAEATGTPLSQIRAHYKERRSRGRGR